MKPAPVIWFTGISGSGKSTLAKALYEDVSRTGQAVKFLDGDEVRSFFEGDLGYTRAERIHNVRRIAFAAHQLSECGIAVIVANIAPYFEVRDFIRRKLANYIQVYLKTSLEVVASRDVQGHYGKFRAAELSNLIGLDDVYDEPRHPDLVITTGGETVATSLGRLRVYMCRKGVLPE